MRKLGLLFVLSAIVAYGCKDLGTEAGPETGMPPNCTVGKLVVDEFSVECEAKVNPLNDSVQAYFPVRLRYHFEGSWGSVSTVTFLFDRQFGVTLATNGWLDSVGIVRSLTPTYWTTTQLAQRDSVLVECTLSGSYATVVEGNPQGIGSWTWSAERKVLVRRRDEFAP